LAVEVSDKRAIDAFIVGLRRGDLVKEMGRIKPKTVSDLMDIANRFADGEDACSHSQVAVGYKDTKATTVKVWDTIATAKKTTKSFSQGNPESITHHQKICSTDHVIFTLRLSTGNEYPDMQ
jgi:hypothetical protein